MGDPLDVPRIDPLHGRSQRDAVTPPRDRPPQKRREPPPRRPESPSPAPEEDVERSVGRRLDIRV